MNVKVVLRKQNQRQGEVHACVEFAQVCQIAVNFLTAMQVRSDWSLLVESQVIIFARFLTNSPHTRKIYGKSCLSRIIKTNFFIILHSKTDDCLLLEVCHVNMADVLVLVLIVLNFFRAC